MPKKTHNKGFTKESLIEIRKTDKKLICNKCKLEKPIKNYSGKMALSGFIYLDYTCNSCKYQTKLLKYPDKIDSYLKIQRDKEIYTIEGRASRLRNSSKQRAKVYGFEFDLSKQLIIEKLKKGICEVTKIPLEFTKFDLNPYAPSIDRIDSSKGYLDDNIQITCMIYNFCKNQFEEEQVKDFFKKLNIYGQ